MKINTYYLLLLISSIIITTTKNYSTTYKIDHPHTLYNKGLEEYNKNNLGQAMFFVTKALILAPSDPKIRTLFYTLRKEIGVAPIFSTDNKNNLFLSKLFSKILPQYNALIGGILFIFASMIYAYFLLSKRTIFSKIYLCLFIFSGIFIIQAFVQYYLYFNTKQRILLHTSALYEEPITNSIMITTLPAGSELTIIDNSDNFFLVKTLDGKEAWIISNSLPKLF